MRKFLKEYFAGCDGNIFASSLDNVKERSAERSVATTDLDRLEKFCRQNDVDGRGTFFCVSTIQGSRRTKARAVATPALWADIDLKDVDLPAEEILARLMRLEAPPSRVHHSGNGIHAYWLLEAPALPGDELEAVLKKLARSLAGDMQVTQSVALMRMPGTHNTKRERRKVEVLHEGGERHSFDSIAVWDIPVVMAKKGANAEPTNPFLEHAEKAGFKPPMDVEAELAGMAQGNIHDTQLRAAAALSERGMDEDEVAEVIMAATRKVAPSGWNWRKEEQAVRAMVRDWGAKRGPRKESNVVSLKDVRTQKEQKVNKKELHVILARGMLSELRQRGEQIMMSQGHMYWYRDSRWRMVPLAEQREWIDRGVERGCRVLKVLSKNTLVNETRGYILRDPDIHREDVPWDSHGKVAVKSGLLDLGSFSVEPHKPEDWTTRVLDCDYDPAARCPWFMQMLQDMLPEDVVGLLQEIMGSFLLKERPREMRRALVLVGGSATGKSSLITIMSEFFSKNVVTSRLEALENAHGLMAFLEPDPWVLHEAFEQGKWHFSANAKSLLSADPIGVNIKNGPMVSHVFKEPILWGTNVPPQFRESTKAMQNRLAVVSCSKVFSEVPTGAAAEAARHGQILSRFVLDREKPGILNWALEGLVRLRQRGHFDMPANTLDSMHDMWLNSNVAAGFMEECAEYDETKMIALPDFVAAFTAWWHENRGSDTLPSSTSLSMALKALGDGRIRTNDLRDRRMRYYGGFFLNERGLDYWSAYAGSRAALDGTARLSTTPEEVKKDIPGGPRQPGRDNPPAATT